VKSDDIIPVHGFAITVLIPAPKLITNKLRQCDVLSLMKGKLDPAGKPEPVQSISASCPKPSNARDTLPYYHSLERLSAKINYLSASTTKHGA
jgi:hypothetical protein